MNLIAVYGYARGGTSAVAGTLARLGVDMGAVRDGPNAYPNGDGYIDFECMDYWHLHTGMRDRDRRAPGPSDLWKLRCYIARRLRFARATGRVPGVKFPGLHLWSAVPGYAELPLTAVRVWRREEDVVASSAAKLPEKRLDWAASIEGSRRSMARAGRLLAPVLTVSYHDLVAIPERVVPNIVAQLGLAPTDEQVACAIESVAANARVQA